MTKGEQGSKKPLVQGDVAVEHIEIAGEQQKSSFTDDPGRIKSNQILDCSVGSQLQTFEPVFAEANAIVCCICEASKRRQPAHAINLKAKDRPAKTQLHAYASTIIRPCVYESRPLRYLYAFLCCSRKTNVKMVCGPSLMNDGTQPLNIQINPSFCVVCLRSVTMLVCSVALMTLVLTTSTGEQIVVATKPAMREAVKCVVRLSFMSVFLRSMLLKMS
jgi:hypothetical protein